MLKTHYRSPIDWTLSGLKDSEKTLVDWHALLPLSEEQNVGWNNRNRELYPPLLDALCDDLNTAKAIS